MIFRIYAYNNKCIRNDISYPNGITLKFRSRAWTQARDGSCCAYATAYRRRRSLGNSTRSLKIKRGRESGRFEGKDRAEKARIVDALPGPAPRTLSAITNCDFGSRTRCGGSGAVTWLIVTSVVAASVARFFPRNYLHVKADWWKCREGGGGWATRPRGCNGRAWKRRAGRGGMEWTRNGKKFPFPPKRAFNFQMGRPIKRRRAHPRTPGFSRVHNSRLKCEFPLDKRRQRINQRTREKVWRRGRGKNFSFSRGNFLRLGKFEISRWKIFSYYYIIFYIILDRIDKG